MSQLLLKPQSFLRDGTFQQSGVPSFHLLGGGNGRRGKVKMLALLVSQASRGEQCPPVQGFAPSHYIAHTCGCMSHTYVCVAQTMWMHV